MDLMVIGVLPGHKGRIGHHDHTHFIGQTPVAGLVAAPTHMELLSHRQTYSSLFGTTAQVVATLFVALAIEARHASIRNRFFTLTIVYIAIGLVAAVVAGSTGLPAWSYRFLLGLALGGGAGALASTVLVARWAKEQRSREQAPPPPP